MRALCSGKTSAFQADDAGSIPAARFFDFAFQSLSFEAYSPASKINMLRSCRSMSPEVHA